MSLFLLTKNHLDEGLNQNIVLSKDQRHSIISLIQLYSPGFLKYSNLKNHMYLLYVIADIFKQYEEHYDIENSNKKYLDDIFIPNMLLLLKNNLKYAYAYMDNILKIKLKEYKNNKIYDTKLFKTDIISLFIKEYIFDINPLKLETIDLKEYYDNLLNYLIQLYISSNSGKNSFESNINFFKQDTFLSTRHNIYKQSIRKTQIDDLCIESESIRRIYSNFKQLSGNIVHNELQQMYAVIVDNDNKHSNKSLILKFNDENNSDINKVKKQFPEVYKYLRSIKIDDACENDNIYNDEFKQLLKNKIYDKVYANFSATLSDNQAKILSDTISIKIEQSITKGKHLDPYDLDILYFNNVNFIDQLCKFIHLILKNAIIS